MKRSVPPFFCAWTCGAGKASVAAVAALPTRNWRRLESIMVSSLSARAGARERRPLSMPRRCLLVRMADAEDRRLVERASNHLEAGRQPGGCEAAGDAERGQPGQVPRQSEGDEAWQVAVDDHLVQRHRRDGQR